MSMNKERISVVAQAVATLGSGAASAERMEVAGTYTAVIHEAVPGHEAEYVALLERINGAAVEAEYAALMERLERVRRVKWSGTFPNLVTTVGKNKILDESLAASAYTATWFLGLISSTSFSAVNAADTMASHAGWLEAGTANTPTYSGARKTAAWSSASAGSKSLSAGLVFTFTGTGTVKGCFMNTVSTVDGTTGVLLSAGLFTGGDQPVVSTNTLTVSYSLAA